MIVLVNDEPLRRLLATGARIMSTWPQTNEDVRVLVKLLQVTIPSLADVLATGLVVLTVVSAKDSIVALTLGDVFLIAIAQDGEGRRVRDPMNNPERVVRLDIVDVQSEGRSGAEVAR
ncbi:MAG: hypothetical protein OSB43_04135 [Nocardioides sp.]|uniref:hypothetical protein n=1 Tax=Nocardioides sp. TaxID=35761 RepID=UPI00239CB87D|nr:hypothetical protein [Nocardioides sp.]MDE0775446.1 hypothetical protein [Nocardioides sp.]